jgi:hypothetical protein
MTNDQTKTTIGARAFVLSFEFGHSELIRISLRAFPVGISRGGADAPEPIGFMW